MSPVALEPPDPPLADAVIALRPVDRADIDQITAACQDERIQRFIPVPRPYTPADAADYVARAERQWASGEKAAFTITDVGDPTAVLGVISLSLVDATGNCGYWIAPDQRGRGVARRALSLVTDCAIAAHQHAVILLEINEHTPASREVARAVGDHQAGRIDVNTVTGKRGGLIFSRLVSDVPIG
jgi:RimJ/RimL family protein N-acetyltransferase